MKALICACCGSRAFGKQWWNRDTGFGLCAKCVQFIADRESEAELALGYGKRGVHFATPLTRACRPGMLVSWKTPDDAYHIGVLKAHKGSVSVIRGVDADEGEHRIPCGPPGGADLMKLKTITAYIQTKVVDGQSLWALIIRNEPIGGFTDDMRAVLRAAMERLGRVTLEVWDCDRGEFVSELLADPGW